MTEYHHIINHIYFNATKYGGKLSVVNAVSCIFEALNDAFEVQFFQLFIVTPNFLRY